MAFRDIIKKQREKGSGLISSVGAASLASLKESADPRNYLFKSGGLLNALFPKVKGYRYKDTEEKLRMSADKLNATLASEKLDGVVQRLDIVGKNTMVLPMMSRDMNIMRQSLVKLVKLNGGTQRDKADRFFSRAKEVEALYESKLGVKSTSPTKVESKSSETGFFGGLLSVLTGNLLSTIVKGGLITGALVLIGKGIKEFFENPEFRKNVLEGLGGMFDFLKGDFTKELALGLAGVVGVFALFKVALAGLVGAISRAALSLGGKGVLGTAAAAAGTFMGVDYLQNRLQEIGTNAGSTGANVSSQITTTDAVVAGGTAAAGAYLGAKGVQNVVQAAKATGDVILDVRTQSVGQLAKSTPTSRWGKFLAFVAKRSPALWGRVATKLAAAGTMATIPFAGWVAAAIQLGFSFWTAWELYELWTEFNKLKEDETETTQPTPTSPSVTPVPAAPTTPTPASGASMPPSPTVPSTPPSRNLALLDLIASGEAISSDPYNSMNQGTSGGQIIGSGVSSAVIGKNLTDMTVGEIMSKAASPNDGPAERKRKGAIFAAGRYQIIPDTLKDLVNANVVSREEKFTPELQDRLAQALIERSGAQQSLNEGNILKAQEQLSSVWAAIADPRTGRSKYGSGNKASISSEQFRMAATGATGTTTMVAQAPTVTPKVATVDLTQSTPTQQTGQVARPASLVADLSTALADAKAAWTTNPIIINSPTGRAPTPMAQAPQQPQYTAPAVVDSEFMKLLVNRVA